MPVDSSIYSGGKLYNSLVNFSYKVIKRMESKWGVNCDVYYCKDKLEDLDLYSINTDELSYEGSPDLTAKLVIPSLWENYGVNDFNIHSHSAEELETVLYTVPSLKIPLLSKVVVRENMTNRVYIIRKSILEHYNRSELYLKYYLDVMASDDAISQMEGMGLPEKSETYSWSDISSSGGNSSPILPVEDLSIYNTEKDSETYIPPGVSVKPLGG